jgi:hypothetical protein
MNQRGMLIAGDSGMRVRLLMRLDDLVRNGT